ncbi:MAG: hypothetical protein M3Y24_05610 [Acidobacteriota bacterium]|nr:hypothetical protein [Acidobacteriota bacterium]
MRFFRKRIAVSAIFCFACVLALGARLNRWADDTITGSVIEKALFRLMALPGGSILARRPPSESVAQVTGAIQRSPEQGDLYAIRAQEEERALNFAAAEADWKKVVSLSSAKASAWVDLADFYHRRLEPSQETDALLHAAQIAPEGLDRYRPETQPAWMQLSRAVFVAEEAVLPPAVQEQVYRAWIAAYPNSATPYRQYADFLTEQKNRDGTRALEAQIAAKFPNDVAFQIESEAKFASIDGGPDAELTVYSRRFTPLWPADLRTRYYELLKGAHQLRTFLANARADAAAHPAALEPALRIYFYYESEGNRNAADAELLAWQARHAANGTLASATELLTLGPLFERVGDYDESARASYTLYEMSSASPSEKEEALSRLISLLLDVPEQPLALGRRDLSLYLNIAQMDRHPGFLNGILSLALNSTSPQYEYENASQTAATYFHRASASRFLELMKQQFPNSSRTGALEAKLFGAYAAYDQNDALIRLVPGWLAHNADSVDYVNAALELGDAYALGQRTAGEFALYDDLLAKLASKSEHVPLGPAFADEETPTARADANETNNLPAPLARSGDYARVLDRYISRLTATQRLPEALALYKREIDRNPDDPGLYKRLALFVEQNRLDAQLAQTYRAAFDHFKSVSWADKLARLYLRRKQLVAYQALDRQVINIFSGTELAGYVTSVAPDPKINPVLYRQINLYAHGRFPHNLTFVRNLLNAYENKATADPPAYGKLLRENWFYDAGLRTTFFEYLSRTGKLPAELAALPAVDSAARNQNVVALQMRGEALAWLTRFESAAPALAKLAELTPGDRGATDRAISVERSLAPSNPRAFDTAIALAERDVKAAPRDAAALTRVGEIYADRDLYVKAAPWWDRVAKVDPGSADGYLEAATVFWDYFQYGDALRLISDARQTGKQRARFAYEAGAIYENQGNFSRAVAEYLAAASEEPPTGTNASARDRLLKLARRKETVQLVEERSAYLTSGRFDSRAIELRIALLENQGRTADIHSLLNGELARVSNLAEAEEIRHSAERFGFDDTAARALERTIALTTDPVEKVKARVDLAVFRENHNDENGAERDFSALLRDNPELLGVVRNAVDFYWREKEYGKAVSILASAASGAQQSYQDQLRREAAQKASDSGDYATARNLLDQLLAADPFNGDLLAQKAATYAVAKDNAGLLVFYTDQMKALESAALLPRERNERTAALRRGYIPALITAGQFDAALEQYEQIAEPVCRRCSPSE